MPLVVAALFALLAAVGNASGTVLQRIAAQRVPLGDAFSVRLVPQLLRSSAWLGGVAVIVGASACQALALALGTLSLVQPILVTELPFTLLIAGLISRHRLPALGWRAVFAIAAGLGLGLSAASPTEGAGSVTPAMWVLALVATVGAMTACVLAALPRPRGRARAAFFGSASAIGYALTATLMKSSVDAFSQHGAGAFWASWQTYGFVAAGAVSLLLLANAMGSGPLIASQPALTLGEALVSLALGILVYGDRVRGGWWLVPEAIGALLITWGVFLLSRIETDGHESSLV